MTHEEKMIALFRGGKTYEEALELIKKDEQRKIINMARFNLFKFLDLPFMDDEESDLKTLHKVLGINQEPKNETVADKKIRVKKEREEILKSGEFKFNINTEIDKYRKDFDDAVKEVRRVCGIDEEEKLILGHTLCSPTEQIFTISRNNYGKCIATIKITTPDFYSCDTTPKILIDFK